MNMRTIVFAAAALVAVSTAFAEQPRPAAEPRPAAREHKALEELAAGMREILRAAVPEIRIPAIELKLPALDAAAR